MNILLLQGHATRYVGANDSRGDATRVRTFAVRDAVLTGKGVAGMNMESVKQKLLFGCVGGEVVPVRSGSDFQLSASGELVKC